MVSNNHHLAQVNIARAKGEMDSAVMSGFVARLDEINALADASPGFVWRLQTEAGDATAIRVFDDPLLIVNLSVWESIEALRAFVYRTRHTEVLANRATWFDRLHAPHLALWWIRRGDLPSVEEARDRLAHLAAHGPSPTAFTFARTYPPTVTAEGRFEAGQQSA